MTHYDGREGYTEPRTEVDDTARTKTPPAADALPGLVQALRAMCDIFKDTSVYSNGYKTAMATAINIAEPYEAKRLALQTEVAALKMVLDSTRIGCEAAEDEARALHRERKGEVWYWQGDDEDRLESLACPVLIEAGDMRRIEAERLALRAENAELRGRVLELETDCRDLLQGTKQGHAERDKLRAALKAAQKAASSILREESP